MADEDLSAAKLYGKGVFTTVAVHAGQPFLWDKHWRRLAGNAAILDIDLTEHPEANTLELMLAQIGLQNGRARVTLFDESPSRIWTAGNQKKTSLSIIVAERRPTPDNFNLTMSPHRINTTSPLVGIKSCNYLEHLLAFEEATNRRFHEAIRLNERGEIASACMANVFWEGEGKLYTPSLKTGCLPGTTREYILENIDCAETNAGIEELETADRIFLTSAGLGVAPVADFNGRRLDTSGHPLSTLLPF